MTWWLIHGHQPNCDCTITRVHDVQMGLLFSQTRHCGSHEQLQGARIAIFDSSIPVVMTLQLLLGYD